MCIDNFVINKEYLYYIFFAVLSTILNYVIQVSVEAALVWSNLAVFKISLFSTITVATLVKLCTATGSAFVFKYLCDRNIVFPKAKQKKRRETVKSIFLYGTFAIFTTSIFWITEILFKIFFDLEYVGMVIGLTTGYTIKFFLDRRFVFSETAEIDDELVTTADA